jgi:rhodanese-related sulfurtransferase
VRPPDAFEKETIPGAINIPLAELDKRLSEFSKDTTLVFT